MNSTIKVLLNVQEIDRTIHKLRKKIKELNGNSLLQEKDIDKATKESEKFASQITQLKNDKRDSDLLIEEKTIHIDTLNNKSKLIKTAKEQKALEVELNTAQTAINKIEDQMLSILSDIDEYTEKLKVSQDSVDLLQNKYAETKKERTALIDSIMLEIDDKKSNRSKILENLDDSVIARYENINKWAEGNSLAELKVGSCLGCFLMLPPQVATTVTETDQLSLCPNCGRILYMKG